MRKVQMLFDGGYVIDDLTSVVSPSHSLYREIERRAALPIEDSDHIDILPADPPPAPLTPNEKLDVWRADEVNAALLEVLAADSGRTSRQIDDAITAVM